MTMKVQEIKLSYNGPKNSPQIRSSEDAYNILIEDWDDWQLCESFKVILLNRANKVMGVTTISKGGITGTVVDSKILFAAALKGLACSIILAHNHPSGNKRPSQADIDITKKITEGAKLLDIVVLDHVIVAGDLPGEYYSFADNGNI